MLKIFIYYHIILIIVLVIKISALNPDPHPHLESAFGMRIQETKIMRIHADADPQHCHFASNINLNKNNPQ